MPVTSPNILSHFSCNPIKSPHCHFNRNQSSNH
uniref:Uncharacterized protein n=1 Tax=Siphoviridae sp. ctJhT5 TaxID=2826242 RepID=A0A8S5QZK3_9CAUD|nr:MAG TPA: hypothetical protein [Siphoviridae sp. ctJhT5]DAI62172.1 MAG TPA: hypothetical protein [Caudoviricetes sp.]DAJ02393.1 MAG TPA: hypothetical protein [Caudoviricetes sp.]